MVNGGRWESWQATDPKFKMCLKASQIQAIIAKSGFHHDLQETAVIESLPLRQFKLSDLPHRSALLI
jgi:hypothetical protein